MRLASERTDTAAHRGDHRPGIPADRSASADHGCWTGRNSSVGSERRQHDDEEAASAGVDLAGIAIIAAACSSPAATTAPARRRQPPRLRGPGVGSPGGRVSRRRHPLALVRLGRRRDRRPQHRPRAVRAANPDLNIEVVEQPFDQIFTKWRTEVAAGGGADMFIAPNDDLGKDAREESIANLDEFLADNPALEGYLPVALDGSKVDGKFYMVPESLKAVAMWYNKSAIAIPRRQRRAPCGRQGRLGQARHQPGRLPPVRLDGRVRRQLMNDAGKCTADARWLRRGVRLPQGAEGRRRDVQHRRQRPQDGLPDRRDQRDHRRPVADRGLPDALGDKLAVAPIPDGPSGPANPFTGTDGWYINPNLEADQAELAVNVALALTSPATSRSSSTTPATFRPTRRSTISDAITQGFADAAGPACPDRRTPSSATGGARSATR